ncbi:hypothetical protein ACR6C2_25705 [Streptomyces sp. INA 01156]
MTLDGSFMDHAAYEALQDWQKTHTAGAARSRSPAADPEPESGSPSPRSSRRTRRLYSGRHRRGGPDHRRRVPLPALDGLARPPVRAPTIRTPGDFVPTGGSVPNDDRSVHDAPGLPVSRQPGIPQRLGRTGDPLRHRRLAP